MYIGFVIYVSFFALIMLLIFSKTCRKVVAGAIIFAILLGVVVLPLHGAMAEELPELFIIEQFEEVEVEYDCLKLTFDFHGELLSFYWEGPLNLTQPVWVTIWNNIEVIDAGYVELPSGSLLFYFLRQLGTDEHINRLYAGYGGVLCIILIVIVSRFVAAAIALSSRTTKQQLCGLHTSAAK